MKTETVNLLSICILFLVILIGYGLLFFRKQEPETSKKSGHPFLFSEEMYQALGEMSEFFKKDRAETIQLALGLLMVSKNALAKGDIITVVDKNGKSTEIVFPDCKNKSDKRPRSSNIIKLFPDKE